MTNAIIATKVQNAINGSGDMTNMGDFDETIMKAMNGGALTIAGEHGRVPSVELVRMLRAAHQRAEAEGFTSATISPRSTVLSSPTAPETRVIVKEATFSLTVLT